MAAMRLVRPLEWVCLTAEWPPRARRAAEREQHLRPIGQQLHTGLGAPRRVQAQPCPESCCSLQGSRPSGDSDSRTTVSGTGKCTSRAVGFDSVESESDSQGQPCHHDGARLRLSFGHQMSYGLEPTKPVPDRQQALLPAGTILTWLQALGTHGHSLSQPNSSTW